MFQKNISEEDYQEPETPRNKKYVYRDIPKQTINYEIPKTETKEEIQRFSGILGRSLFK